MKFREHAHILYAECMSCSNSEQQCPGTWKDIPQGIPPRGFYCDAVPVKLLIVGRNPGHPQQEYRERERFRGLTGSKLLHEYRRLQDEKYAAPKRFHKRLFRYLRFFLDLPENVDWKLIFMQAAYTTLVKCSTWGERDRLDYRTKDECFNRYFLREIELLRPRVLLALGNEVEDFLENRKTEHRLPIVKVKHPSYAYSRESEAMKLAEIKARLRRHF